jgi:hypothetical protein
MDLLVSWYGSSTDTGRVAIFTNKNDGTGTLNPSATSYYVGKGPAGLVAGDFNGDGTQDLAVVDGNDGALSVLLDAASETASLVLKNVSLPGTGTQNVFARYLGDANYATSDSTTIPLTGSGVPAPVLTSLSPSTAVAGGPAFTLTVNGSNFATGAVVKWNGGARTTAFVGATKLTAAILAADIVAAANYTVTVVSGGVTSNSLTFTVTATAMGPVITSLSPSSAAAGGSAFTLTVNGTGFATGAVVKWNGNARTTAFVSATKVTAAILEGDIASAGTFPVTVTSGGATSNAVSFTVTGQGGIPTLTAISPNYAIVGSPSLTMTVTGSGFVPGTSGTKAFWNGNGLATTYVSATQVTAIVPASDMTTLGTEVVTVGNSGMLASASMPFTVAPATHTPLAYGYFNLNGSAGATSGNITCAWNSPEYLCTITGETFFYSKYVVNVTAGDSNAPAIAAVNSISGKIIVKMYNMSGTAIQYPFYIVVFKP